MGLTAETILIDDEVLVMFEFPAEQSAWNALTPAEREIAGSILRGLTAAQIAAARGVSTATVASQLQSIYRKVGVSSRAELVCKLC